jgi:hypothetical protein
MARRRHAPVDNRVQEHGVGVGDALEIGRRKNENESWSVRGRRRVVVVAVVVVRAGPEGVCVKEYPDLWWVRNVGRMEDEIREVIGERCRARLPNGGCPHDDREAVSHVEWTVRFLDRWPFLVWGRASRLDLR